MRSLLMLALIPLAGCATFDPVPTKVHVANVQTSTFCRQMSEIGPAGEKKFALDWDIDDTPATATRIEKVGERYKAACQKNRRK